MDTKKKQILKRGEMGKLKMFSTKLPGRYHDFINEMAASSNISKAQVIRAALDLLQDLERENDK